MRPLSLIPLILLAACAEPPAPESFSARDSAGIRIVEHASFDGLPVRVVSEPPEVAIGTALGDEAQQLDRVLAGVVLSDGRIALLNAGSAEVRIYDGAGALVARQGRQGEGPEEYSQPSNLVATRSDSLLVWDVALRRGTVLTPDGVLARTFPIDGEVTLPLLGGAFGSGEPLIVDRDPGLRPGPLEGGLVREMVHEYRYSAEGARQAHLGDHPGRTMLLLVDGKVVTTTPSPDQMMEIRVTTFGAIPQRAVAADGYWLGTQQAPEVAFRDPSGAPRALVRWSAPRLPVTDADKASHFERLLAEAPDEAARVRLRGRGLESFEFAEFFPTHGALLAAADGALWMADYQRPGETGPARWTVVGADGVARERVELPAGSTTLWASAERVLLLVEDELGVQRVELRALETREAP